MWSARSAAGAAADPRLARMLVAMLCSLRGSVCLYQGEELGLAEAEVPFEAPAGSLWHHLLAEFPGP